MTRSENLADKSAAIQGLSGLEYLLFGTGHETIATEDGAHRCAFAEAIAGNLVGISAELAQEWNDPAGYSALMLEPRSSNATYRSANEVAVEVFALAVNGLEAIQDLKVKPVLGATLEKAKPKRAQFWRSGQTFRVMEVNWSVLRDLHFDGGLLSLLPPDKQGLQGSFRLEFSYAKRVLGSLIGDVLESFTDDPERGSIVYTTLLTDSLLNLLKGEVGPALGIQSGFSSLDGD
mgnify:CR=1 FL=1